MHSPGSRGDHLFRRIKKGNPQMVTRDLETGELRPHAAALRCDDGRSMSCHSSQILHDRGRDPLSVYPSDLYGSVRFPAEVAWEAGGSVRHSPIADEAEEPDEDRRAAHCDVHPSECKTKGDQKRQWKLIAYGIAHASEWVQAVV